VKNRSRLALAVLALGLSVAAAAQTPAAQIGAAPETVPTALAQKGVLRFLFSAWPGAPIPVWYLRPKFAAADAPVLFVLHGVGRDADRYIGEWVDLATSAGITIIVPEFTAADFPKSLGYNHGGLFTPDGTPRPREVWAFSAIEPMFDAVKAREGLTAPGYSIYGHSAGAQFVHRLVLTGSGPRMLGAISANAGSYAMPTTATAWPFGMADLAAGVWRPRTAFGAPMTLLLGTADNDPAHRSLPDQPEARAQGAHRLARGLQFRETAVEGAKAAGVPLAWGCALAPGVGHDNGRMAPYALAIVTGTARPEPGAPCAVIAPGHR
jgi:poly(3-hydroxybutyrate) depolymerase